MAIERRRLLTAGVAMTPLALLSASSDSFARRPRGPGPTGRPGHRPAGRLGARLRRGRATGRPTTPSRFARPCRRSSTRAATTAR